jgi:CheY-like chemotaxis protein
MIEDPILLVDDNPDDLELMQLAFRRARVTNPVHTVEDGESAIAYLQGVGAYADRQRHPLPYLVLLDVKLPGKNGIEVLQWIRAHLDHAVVVVMLSSSAQPRDVAEAAKSHCNSYLVKPDSLHELVKMVELIKDYWIERNQWIR